HERWLCSGKLTWPGVTHQRFVLGRAGVGLWIADWIESDSPRIATWFWQLPADTDLPSDSSDTAIMAQMDSVLLKCWSNNAIEQNKLLGATQDKPTAWRALGYGLKSEGRVLTFRQPIANTLLTLSFVGICDHPQVAASFSGHRAGPSGLEREVCSWQHAGCEWSHTQ
ncbi:MAG: hypothetical protein AAF483_30195, partial [Planctomycetota bacterium]